MYENFKLKGRFRIENTTTGEVREIDNTIVAVGFSSISSLMLSGITSANAYGHMSIGVGSETVTTGDTVLGSEAFKEATTNSQTTTSLTNDTATFIGSFNVDATKAINEAGLFNAAGTDTGSMFSRTTFADLSATSGDSINASWDIAGA